MQSRNFQVTGTTSIIIKFYLFSGRCEIIDYFQKLFCHEQTALQSIPQVDVENFSIIVFIILLSSDKKMAFPSIYEVSDLFQANGSVHSEKSAILILGRP